MLLSEIGDKEIIDLSTGTRHGRLWDSDLLFDEETGKIKAILIPDGSKKARYSGLDDYRKMPWSSIQRIGDDMIIFKSSESYF